MNTAETLDDLLNRLTRSEIHLSVIDDQLAWRAPGNALTEDLRATLKARKTDIIAKLKERSAAGTQAPAPRLTRRATAGRHPPTRVQRMWAIEYTRALKHRGHHLVSAGRLRGALDLAAVEHSIRELLARQAILRAHYEDETDFWMVVPDVREVPIQRLQAQGDRELLERIEELATPRFDLLRGPLLRVALVDLGPDELALIMVFPHSIYDARSLQILWSQLTVLYQAQVTGRQPPLTQPDIQYGDYAWYQREWLASDAVQSQEHWWRERFSGFELPFSPPLDQTSTPRGDDPPSIRDSLDATTVQALTATGQRLSISLPTIMLTAFLTVLAHWYQREDVVTRVLHHGRWRRELADMVGCFMDTWMLRARVRRDATFAQVLRDVHDTCAGAAPYLELPGELITRQLMAGKTADPVHITRFNYMPRRNLGDASAGMQVASDSSGPPGGGLDALHVTINSRRAQLKRGGGVLLAIVIREDDHQTLHWTVRHDPSLLTIESSARFSRNFAALLRAVSADASVPVGELPLS